MKLPHSSYNELFTLGCDPELFITISDQVVGSEKVIPVEGLLRSAQGATPIANQMGVGKVIRDGIQVELNPSFGPCRANLINEIKACMIMLVKHLQEHHPTAHLSFQLMQEVNEDELRSLSESSRILGCAPSLNLYDTSATPGVDGSTYRLRSAGGHIHLGLPQSMRNHPAAKFQLVQTLDILLGNTCVLLDRDPANAIRRQVYGRAGEYRLPPHGVEYRTLSNFWLRHHALTSLVLGLARMAVETVFLSTSGLDSYNSHYGRMDKSPGGPWMENLFKSVDQNSIIAAINLNSFELARENFKMVKAWIQETIRTAPGGYYSGTSGKGLMPEFLEGFDYLVDHLDEVISEDPLVHWTSNWEGHVGGAEDLLRALTIKAKQIQKEVPIGRSSSLEGRDRVDHHSPQQG